MHWGVSRKYFGCIQISNVINRARIQKVFLKIDNIWIFPQKQKTNIHKRIDYIRLHSKSVFPLNCWRVYNTWINQWHYWKIIIFDSRFRMLRIRGIRYFQNNHVLLWSTQKSSKCEGPDEKWSRTLDIFNRYYLKFRLSFNEEYHTQSLYPINVHIFIFSSPPNFFHRQSLNFLLALLFLHTHQRGKCFQRLYMNDPSIVYMYSMLNLLSLLLPYAINTYEIRYVINAGRSNFSRGSERSVFVVQPLNTHNAFVSFANL